MNIGNITSDNFNLDSNGKDMQIEVYEQLIEQLQQENKHQKEIINEAISIINEHFKHHPELFTENQREYDLIRKIEHILKGK